MSAGSRLDPWVGGADGGAGGDGASAEPAASHVTRNFRSSGPEKDSRSFRSYNPRSYGGDWNREGEEVVWFARFPDGERVRTGGTESGRGLEESDVPGK